MKRTHPIRITFTAWMMAIGVANAATLLNGSFESLAIPPNTLQRGTPDSWISGGPVGFIFNGIVPNPPAGNWPGPQDGQQFADIGNTASSSLSQTFSIANSGFYELSWFDNAFPGADTSPYRVTIVSSSLQTILTANYNAAHPGDWLGRTESVNLPTDTYTLTFTPQGIVGGYDTLLDNVSLTSVPEPSTAVFGIFTASVFLCRRRRATQKA